jgi:hypothetical protein
LGEARKDPWNGELGFVKSFAHWAIKRKLIKASLWIDEEPEWKKKFDGYDRKVLEDYDKRVDLIQASSNSESRKATLYMMGRVNMERWGYFEQPRGYGMEHDDHPCREDVPGKNGKYNKGMIDGEYHDGDGWVYSPKEEDFED